MMNERVFPAEVPGRVLKSLLKKPGQTRPKSHKNRVIINEKLNEFFAADYIILIKEECCADYAEECDCCCQKPEKIRLGNCKECRADVVRNMTNSGDFTNAEQRYDNKGRNGGVRGGTDCEMDSSIGRDNRQGVFGCEESQEEDDEEEDDDEDEEEEEDEEDEEEEEEEDDEEDEEIEDSDDNEKCRRAEIANCNMLNCVTPLQKVQDRPQQQQETLSPPEGYKDVCDEDTNLENDDQTPQRLVCGECNYYHRQRNAATGADYNNEGKVQLRDDETKSGKEMVLHGEDDEQATSDQAQQTTPDVHQRYLVETITMTTVTERRIVREISEEETRPLSNDDPDAINANDEDAEANDKLKSNVDNDARQGAADDSKTEADDNDNQTAAQPRPRSEDSDTSQHNRDASSEPSPELSLSFKLGNVSLGLNNSLKPNSAVRQLFPDPRFISPPPAPTKSALAGSGLSHDEATDSDSSEAQKFLITTESLRLFDAVKRSKMAGSRSDSSESENSSIKRTIERNALRRSLICKYETSSRKKNLRSKDLTLEERIRQLTCVDQDDDDNTGGSSASESGLPMTTASSSMTPATTTGTTTTGTISGIDTVDHSGEFPIRTSPSGEERPGKPDSRLSSSRIMSGTNDIQETTMTSTTLLQQTSANAHLHHHHHHHHHHQSTYKRITDLFAQKRMTDPNLPDIGLGDKGITSKEYSASKSSIAKMNTDARKQFLASLAPLSCVASAGVDSRDDHYRLSSKQASSTLTGHRPDSIGYNSDSSYSLEDIEAALRGEERNHKNSAGPPDVTRGTPTGTAPDTLDPTTDELLAFVEQDKTRNERIRRRYNEPEDPKISCGKEIHERPEAHREEDKNDRENENGEGAEVDDNDDDELNDYGFNRRPSVRGIKPQFETSSEIVRQLRSRSLAHTSIAEKTRASFHACPPWPYYEILGEAANDKQTTGTTFLLAAPAQPCDETDDQRNPATTECQDRDDATITRINTMQKQIDDIYQTIAETASTVQVNHERASYLESTLPRAASRGANVDSCHRYSLQEQSQSLGVNGAIHYHEQHPAVGGRMLRIAGGGDGPPAAAYNTLPTKSRRPQTVAIANYPCGVSAVQPSLREEPSKCYRTMYLVPYNGISDPTYQNIQRILPPHSSASYANHIERYPYPRNGRLPDHSAMMQQQQQHPLGSQQPRAYYPRGLPGPPANPHPQSTTGLHLHLHHGPTEDFRFAAHQQHLLQHHQHTNQLAGYNSQTLPAYTVLASSRTNGYPYAMHTAANRTSATDVQTQTVSSPGAPSTANCGSSVLNNPCNNGITSHIGASSSSSNSSSLSSPTKIHQQQRNSCNVAERGVPEGAASAPSHDYSQSNATRHTVNNSFHGHAANVPPPNTQNSVYYAMNV